MALDSVALNYGRVISLKDVTLDASTQTFYYGGLDVSYKLSKEQRDTFSGYDNQAFNYKLSANHVVAGTGEGYKAFGTEALPTGDAFILTEGVKNTATLQSVQEGISGYLNGIGSFVWKAIPGWVWVVGGIVLFIWLGGPVLVQSFGKAKGKANAS